MGRILLIAAVVGLLVTGYSAGSAGAAKLHADQFAGAWGANDRGQLGDGNGGEAGTQYSEVPVTTTADVGLLEGKIVTQVSSGYDNACALASDGTAYCWGDGGHGELGDGVIHSPPNYVLEPVAVDLTGLGGVTFTDISTGNNHTCAVGDNNRAYCWGENSSGQLGDGTTTEVATPTAVSTSGVLSGKNIAQISAGDRHSCAIDTAGVAYCWGENTLGQLGDGSTTNSLVPVAVDTSGALSGRTVTQISASKGDTHPTDLYDLGHTCAVADGKAYCWGDNYYGQVGDGEYDVDPITSPTAVVDTTMTGTVTQISAGQSDTCAVAGGQAFCWGDNADGQLGDGTQDEQWEPVAVSTSGVLNGKTVTQISAGDYSSCAVDNAGAAYCWGDNQWGQLGDNSTTDSLVPVTVQVQTLSSQSLTRPVLSVAVGRDFVIAVYGYTTRPGSPQNAAMNSGVLEWEAPIYPGVPEATNYWVLYKPSGESRYKVFARGLDALSLDTSTYASSASGCPSGATCPRGWGDLAAGSYDWKVNAANPRPGRASSVVTANYP